MLQSPLTLPESPVCPEGRGGIVCLQRQAALALRTVGWCYCLAAFLRWASSHLRG